MDLRTMIVAEAQRQGVDPGVALAIARRETGVSHWRPDGSVVIGQAGEVGVMQVMPSSAPGVDLYDVEKNIAAGVGILRDLFRKYGGDAPKAVAAYKWGERHLDDAMRDGRPVPRQVQNYVNAVLGVSTIYNAGIAKANDTRAGNTDARTANGTTSNAGIALAAIGASFVVWAVLT